MPYPNEHACRLEDPDQYDRLRRQNNAGEVNGKRVDHILGIHDNDGSERQSIRYPLDEGWDDDEDGARQHCQSEGGSFEPSSGGDDMAEIDDLRRRMRDRVSARDSSGYQIRAQDDKAVLRIYGEIHWLFGVDAEQIAAELDQIDTAEIEVQINSPGGDVFDGVAIYNALRAHPARITTRVDGIAASIASVIAQAGDHRTLMSGGQMMVHEAWGLAIGPAGEMRQMADLLDKQTDVIAGIYAERADGNADDFRGLMEDETWFTAQEAVDAGLADAVVTPERQESPEDKTTLRDEISDAVGAVSGAVESAERVGALRAEKGKQLSQVNLEGLDELREKLTRLTGLLGTNETGDEPEPPDPKQGLQREFARFVATTQGAN